jgi:hypothetical protein
MALDALTAAIEAMESCEEGDYSTGHVCHPSFDSDAIDAAIEQARAAIAALQAEPQGWRPIETAPKNKVLLLGYFNAAGRWRTVRGEWFSQEEIDEQWEFPENGSPGWYETCVNADEPPNCWPIEPTHWMPLPTPPKD